MPRSSLFVFCALATRTKCSNTRSPKALQSVRAVHDPPPQFSSMSSSKREYMGKTLDTLEFSADDGIDAALIAQLARCEWIREARNLILAGPVGTGKSHLAIARGIEAAKHKHKVAFVRSADLERTLIEARDARELGRIQRRFASIELLVVDELGFVPFDRTGGELLFNLLSDRHGRRSVVITTRRVLLEAHPRS